MKKKINQPLTKMKKKNKLNKIQDREEALDVPGIQQKKKSIYFVKESICK